MADIDSNYGLLAIRVEIAAGRYRAALDLIDRVETRSPHVEAQKLVLTGQAFEGLNKVAQAHEAYARAQTLAPMFAAPILRQGVLRYRRGDLEGARALLHRYVAIESGNPEAFYYLSLCEQNAERKAEFVRKTAVLDGPGAAWSNQVLKSLPT